MRWWATLGCLGLLAGAGLAQPVPLSAEVKKAFADGFKNARDEPPPLSIWSGRVFQLSRKYPVMKPAAAARPWEGIDFTDKTQAKDYLLAVRKYCYDDNLAFDWQQNLKDPETDRVWFHAPWMHADLDKGREFINGLTRELTSPGHQLHRMQDCVARNWAVSLYNPVGGYTLGQVWKNIDKPDDAAARFEVGTVSVKLLFTTATKEQVPFLEGAPEWDAHVHNRNPKKPYYPKVSTLNVPPAADQIGKVRLLQLDVAVRDSRADGTTGWVFGTFIYHKDAPVQAGESAWHKMVPVGLMWGNDPKVSDPKMIVQSWYNMEDKLLKELRGLGRWGGWKGRLNGPVDNPRSSCLSCHSTAQARQKKDMTWENDPENVWDWFRNLKPDEAFSPCGVSLDYSLQLAKGIQNLGEVTGNLERERSNAEEFLDSPDGERLFPVRRGTGDILPDPARSEYTPDSHREDPHRDSKPTSASFCWWHALGGLAVGLVVGAGTVWWSRRPRPSTTSGPRRRLR